MTRHQASGLAAAAIGTLGWCALLGGLFGGDPMLAIEIAGAVVACLWALLLLRDLIGSHRLANALSFDAREVWLFGVRCEVTPVLEADAVVVGSVRPRIFIGAPLADALTEDELRAVVYHEDHHRRTWAPVRAAALGAWLRLLGRSEAVRGAVLDRLADLEILADADAIRRGSSRRSLARALLKGDVSLQPASFSYAAGRRVERLLAGGSGASPEAIGRLPYEWLPVVLLAVATLGCHAGL